MRGLLAVSLAMLVWGSQVFASLPPLGEREQQLQTIQSWTAQLNQYVPDLNLRISCKLDKEEAVKKVMIELQALRASVNKTARIPERSLINLACTRPECGGGGGGGICRTCLAPEPSEQRDTL